VAILSLRVWESVHKAGHSSPRASPQGWTFDPRESVYKSRLWIPGVQSTKLGFRAPGNQSTKLDLQTFGGQVTKLGLRAPGGSPKSLGLRTPRADGRFSTAEGGRKNCVLSKFQKKSNPSSKKTINASPDFSPQFPSPSEGPDLNPSAPIFYPPCLPVCFRRSLICLYIYVRPFHHSLFFFVQQIFFTN